MPLTIQTEQCSVLFDFFSALAENRALPDLSPEDAVARDYLYECHGDALVALARLPCPKYRYDQSWRHAPNKGQILLQIGLGQIARREAGAHQGGMLFHEPLVPHSLRTAWREELARSARGELGTTAPKIQAGRDVFSGHMENVTRYPWDLTGLYRTRGLFLHVDVQEKLERALGMPFRIHGETPPHGWDGLDAQVEADMDALARRVVWGLFVLPKENR